MNGVVEFLRHALGLCGEPHPSLLTLLGGVPVIGYLIYPNTLVIDDICDSGETLKNAPGVYTATLHYKKSAIVKPTLYAELIEIEDNWVVYPWERYDSAPVRDNT